MKRLTVLILIANAWAQSPGPQSQTPPTFKSGTNLVLVPVIIRDHDGKAVGNLMKEDFEILDQGKPQQITRFSVEKLSDRAQKNAEQMRALEAEAKQGLEGPNSRTEVMATRFVAYLFDDIHLTPGDLSQARAAAIKYLQTALDPGDRAAVFTTSGKISVEFTAEIARVVDGISRILPQNRQHGSTDCPPMTFYEAELVTQLDAGATRAASLEAQRCYGANNNYTLKKSTMDITAAAATAYAEGQHNTQEALQQIAFVVQRLISTPGQRLLILVSPGFYVPQQYRLKENQLLDQAIHANVAVSTLDARGVYQYGVNADASKEGYMAPAASSYVNSFRHIDALVQGEVLGELAEGTGGAWFQNNNDLVEGLRKATAIPEYQYILGFSPRDLKYDGAFHKLKVNLRVKGDDLQARRGYYAPSHPPDVAADLKQRMHDTMFSRDELLDIPVQLQTEFFKNPDGKVNLSVLARIDLKALHYRNEEGRQADTLTVDTGVFDRNGQMVDGTSKTFALKFRQEKFEQNIANGMSEKANFSVTSGSYVVRVVIHDAEGDMMAARNGAVEIP